jgi:APA family basic amino acid/polyamine antiporter
MSESTQTAPRQLGLWSAAALVVATMVGTGVFTTSGFTLAALHEPWAVLLVWVVGAGHAALGALCYGALARAIPESGGEYLFISRTIHPAAGAVVGWLTLPAGFAAPCALSAYAFGKYVATWQPAWPAELSGSVVLIVFTLLHGAHVKRGAWVQTAGVAINLFLILGFIAWGAGKADLPAPSFSAAVMAAPLGVYAVQLMWISYSYFGWNSAAYIGGEIVNPERNIPRAMLLGTAVVAALYLALNFIFLGAAPVGELEGKLEVGRIAAEAVGGAGAGHAVTALISLVLVMSVSSFVMAGPRVYAKMARERGMPQWMDVEDGRPPRIAMWVQTSLSLVMLWTATFDGLLTYVGFSLTLANAATVLGLVLLRRREGAAKVPVPGWPWVPGVFIAVWTVMAVCAVWLRPLPSAVAVATMLAGLAAWWIGRRNLRAS